MTLNKASLLPLGEGKGEGIKSKLSAVLVTSFQPWVSSPRRGVFMFNRPVSILNNPNHKVIK